MTAPAETFCPTAAWMARTRPERWATSGCSIFIASRTTTSSPASTTAPSSTATLTIVPCMGAVRAPLLAAAAARPDAQAGREDDLEPLAADLDDDALGRLLRAVRGGGRRDVRCGEPGEALGELRLDPRRVDGEGGGVLAGELGRLEDGAGEGDHRGDPADLQLAQRAAGPLERLAAVGAGDHELGEHRVEGAGDDVPGGHAGVDTHPRPAGPGHRGDRPGRGQEAGRRVLPVDPELDAVPTDRHLGVAERRAGGDAQLLADEVQAGDLLGHRVLDLEAGVDLEEGDGAVGADEELARARPDAARLARDRDGRLAPQGLPPGGGTRRR